MASRAVRRLGKAMRDVAAETVINGAEEIDAALGPTSAFVLSFLVGQLSQKVGFDRTDALLCSLVAGLREALDDG